MLTTKFTLKLISAKLLAVLLMFRSQGVRESMRFLSYRLNEDFHERRLGIETARFISGKDLGHQNPEYGAYTPAPYKALQYCLDQISIRPGEDTLLDYGCGMGRVIILAGTRPFRRVIGVELSPAMAEKARENIDRSRRRLKCAVEIEVVDARAYSVPDDVTFIHLYNPFNGETLAKVVGNIRESLRRRPRELTILFGNPRRFEEMFGDRDWLEKKDFRWFYQNTGYGIYTFRP